jgi:hypothetical protein
LINQQPSAKIVQIPSIFTVGFLAPVLMSFRDGKNAVNVCKTIRLAHFFLKDIFISGSYR